MLYGQKMKFMRLMRALELKKKSSEETNFVIYIVTLSYSQNLHRLGRHSDNYYIVLKHYIFFVHFPPDEQSGEQPPSHIGSCICRPRCSQGFR